jgi:hypothetical protein
MILHLLVYFCTTVITNTWNYTKLKVIHTILSDIGSHWKKSTFHMHKQVMQIYIKITPTCFGVNTPSSGSSQVVLAEVMNY